MSKLSKTDREAEAVFAERAYKTRGGVSKKIQSILNQRAAQKALGGPVTAGVRPVGLHAKVEAAIGGSRPVTIRLDVNDIERAEEQAKAKGLKYQTYIKMLLHEALADRVKSPRVQR
jgi:hypothetical protein